MKSQDAAMAEVLASGRFPTFARVMAGPGLDLDLDTLFEFGLRQLLDGLAMRTGRREKRLNGEVEE
jgi:hypothetical protein